MQLRLLDGIRGNHGSKILTPSDVDRGDFFLRADFCVLRVEANVLCSFVRIPFFVLRFKRAEVSSKVYVKLSKINRGETQACYSKSL